MKFFKNNQQFDLIIDIFGIDFLKNKKYNKRFIVKYIIRNIFLNQLWGWNYAMKHFPESKDSSAKWTKNHGLHSLPSGK